MSEDGKARESEAAASGAEEQRDADRARELLRSVVDSSPDWIFVKDLEHRFLLVNTAFAHSQRLEPDDMIGRLDSDFWDPALCEGDPQKGTRGFHDDDRDAFQGKLTRNVNDPATFADGSLHIFDTFKGPLFDRNGGIYGVLAYSRDITELRHAERDLRASEHRFRALFEQAAVGVALVDGAAARFVRVNRKFAEILGYSEDALIAIDVLRLSHPDDVEANRGDIERLMRGELRAYQTEKHVVRADGTPVWVELTLSAMGPPGEPSALHIAIIQDISARRAAEDASHRARVELEATLAALPDLLFEVDDQGRIYEFRAPDPALLAVSPEVFLGRTFAEVLPREPATIIQRAIDEALATGGSSGHSYRLEISGATKWFEISIARKPIDSGRPRFIAIVRDITSRVVAEGERRSLEAQLRQSQKMEAVGTLAGGIAHDFNNLLTVIGLSVEAARSALPIGNGATEALDAIELATRRAENLVRQILAFSRKQPASRVVLSANDALLEAVRLLRATLPAGIKLVTITDETAPNVHADPTQLQQVLINLGTNAWQAMPRGSGTITLSVQRVPVAAGHPTLAPGEYVRLRVADDGIGMSAPTLERIFEPFFTTKGAGKGSGLGLSVVHGIVQEHGGAISVASQPGEGATFDVFLAMSSAAALAPSAPTGAIVRGNGARVVYVEDEPALMRPVLQLLEQLGYRPTGFTSARMALEAIRANPAAVDLVMTDLNMPDLSGLELARALKGLRADLPIVLVSGFAPQPHEQLADVGIQHRLSKPFDIATLSVVLRSLVA